MSQDEMSTPVSDGRPIVGRPLVAWSLIAIAAGHIAAAPSSYPGSLRRTWDAGAVGALDRDDEFTADREVGFWYVAAGFVVGLLGLAVREGESRTGRVPRSLGWGLLGLTAWGVALMPRSGFWLFAIPGVAAARKVTGADDLETESRLS